MYGIADSGGFRSATDGERRVRAAIYVLSAAAAAGLAGLALGLLGASLLADTREYIVPAVAGMLAVAGIWDAGVRRLPLLQRDTETPQQWLDLGPVGWAAVNGAALGVGAGSRLGFLLWYAIPLAALLSPSLLFSAFVYGAYGFSRAVAAPTLYRLGSRFHGLDAWLITRMPLARTVTSAYLAFMALVALLGLST